MTFPVQLEETIRTVEAHVNKLSWLVENLYRATGIEWPGEPPRQDVLADPTLADFVQRGALLEAVKRYQALTGAGLAEAKAAVMAAMRR